MASAGVVCRFWSSGAAPAGRMPGLTISVGSGKARSAPLDGVAGGNDAIAPRVDGPLRAREDVGFEVVGRAGDLDEVARIKARHQRHREQFQIEPAVRVPGRRRDPYRRRGHRVAQREKGDAVLVTHVDDGADGVADIARHLEIDEHAFAAQRLQERRHPARHEELEADLEEGDVVEELHGAQGRVDRRHVERDDEAVGASQSGGVMSCPAAARPVRTGLGNWRYTVSRPCARCQRRPSAMLPRLPLATEMIPSPPS